MNNKACGTCKHREYDGTVDDWMCNNRESDNYVLYMPYEYDECDDWEEK